MARPGKGRGGGLTAAPSSRVPNELGDSGRGTRPKNQSYQGESKVNTASDTILQEMRAMGFFLKLAHVMVDGIPLPRCEWTRDNDVTPRFTSTAQADDYAVTMWRRGSWPRHWYIKGG